MAATNGTLVVVAMKLMRRISRRRWSRRREAFPRVPLGCAACLLGCLERQLHRVGTRFVVGTLRRWPLPRHVGSCVVLAEVLSAVLRSGHRRGLRSGRSPGR
eukprot:6784292-Pyramimonas_sp.AAC.1